MLKVEGITKIYGDKCAVDGLSFSLERGCAAGFLGPNGAGKSTTMNIITGYLSATEGSVSIDGEDIEINPSAYKKKIGYLPEVPPLYLDMTLEEYLTFVAELKGVLAVKAEIEQAMEQTNTLAVRGRLIKNLSKGYRQRAGFAQALLGKPPLLVLDEPTIGLDPSQIVEIRALLNELKKQHTILLSSHILSEVTEVCDKVILINEGKMIAFGTQEELTGQDGNRVRLRTDESAKEALVKALMEIPAVTDCNTAPCREVGMSDIVIDCAEEVRESILRATLGGGWPVYELAEVRPSLEDVFMKLTAGVGGDGCL